MHVARILKHNLQPPPCHTQHLALPQPPPFQTPASVDTWKNLHGRISNRVLKVFISVCVTSTPPQEVYSGLEGQVDALAASAGHAAYIYEAVGTNLRKLFNIMVSRGGGRVGSGREEGRGRAGWGPGLLRVVCQVHS